MGSEPVEGHRRRLCPELDGCALSLSKGTVEGCALSLSKGTVEGCALSWPWVVSRAICGCVEASVWFRVAVATGQDVTFPFQG
jgi:hypothetical protein